MLGRWVYNEAPLSQEDWDTVRCLWSDPTCASTEPPACINADDSQRFDRCTRYDDSQLTAGGHVGWQLDISGTGESMHADGHILVPILIAALLQQATVGLGVVRATVFQVCRTEC